MSFISKVELKYQLAKMGINVEGNYVRKKDITKVLSKYDPFADFDAWSAFEAGHFFAENPKANEIIENLFEKIKDEKTFNKVFSSEVWNELPEDFHSEKEYLKAKKALSSHMGYFDDSSPDDKIWGIHPIDLRLLLKNLNKIK